MSKNESQKKVKKAIVDGTHNYSQEANYIEPSSPIKEKLEEFKDMKLGFMVHWGLYQQLGLIASWGLIDGRDWNRKKTDCGDLPYWYEDSRQLREEYFGLKKSFNPLRFNPDEWAELASDNGFKYLIFTTKHHDGFCMWDTKQTDFKVTDSECPFSQNKNADIVKGVFDAFRKKNMAIGAYFSKPDWHCDKYWDPEILDKSSTSSCPNYDVYKNTEKWQEFEQYTHNQLEELVRDYGKIDILWLDGAVEIPHNGQNIMIGETINLGKKIEELRKINPELITVDRLGIPEYENYLTPEMKIPEEVINVPWESCLTLGGNFHYIYDDDYKTPSELISILLDIVCKGGNLALNVSPQPDGRIPRNAIKSIKGFGKWLKKYGEAIFKTRPCAPYKENGVFYTQTRECVYAVTKQLECKTFICAHKISKIECLNTNEFVDFKEIHGGIEICNSKCIDEEYVVYKLYKQEDE